MDNFYVKFEVRNNKIFIIIDIYIDKNNMNNKYPIDVLIDTGAVISTIKTDDLYGVNINRLFTGVALSTPHSKKYTNTDDIPESEKLYKFDIPIISIGNKLLFNLRLGSNDLTNSEVSIIGMDILGHFNLDINYETKTITFEKRIDNYELFTIDNLNSKDILISNLEINGNKEETSLKDILRF